MPSLLEALDKKYGWQSPPPDCAGRCSSGITVTVPAPSVVADLPVAIFVPKRPPRLSVPTLLVLNDCDIETAGDAHQLDDKCAGVEELDLAKNKLTKWEEVFGILQHMPQVKFVNLSFNRLSDQLDALNKRASHNACWSHLRNLVLNSTRVDWASVQALLKLLPALEELHLSLNEYDHVNLIHDDELTKLNGQANENDAMIVDDNRNGSEDDEDKENLNCDRVNGSDAANDQTRLGDECAVKGRDVLSKTYTQVKKLHFSGNPVSNWREICKLGYAFPNLESLVLNECPLNSLDVDGDNASGSEYGRSESECESATPVESPHNGFRNLRFLNLNNTELATWDEVDRLARFPTLTSLRVQGWPLWERCESTEHERRQLLVARLPTVETLNGGGRLGSEEREDAERAFIRYYMERPESDRPERYSELVAVHGKLDPLVNVDLRPEKRVKVTFTFGDVSEVRTVDVYRTVVDLKQKLERMAGFPANKMRLFYVDQDLRDFQGPEEMKFPHKQLYSYNIRSGDEIIVESKNTK